MRVICDAIQFTCRAASAAGAACAAGAAGAAGAVAAADAAGAATGYGLRQQLALKASAKLLWTE